jgi:hypothetical protein
MDDTPDATCTAEGCDREPKTRGMCGMHYMRWWTAQQTVPCTVDGCGRKVYARGLCGMHYQRVRLGQPLGPAGEYPKGRVPTPITERLWAKVDVRGLDECWPWTGRLVSDGYGQIDGQGVAQSVHRVAYEDKVGPIPDGLTIDHLCHSRAAEAGTCPGGPCEHRRCCNPSHMEPVTHAQNVARSVPSQKDRCKRGHDLTDPDNLKPNSRGARQCRECSNISRRERYARLGR